MKSVSHQTPWPRTPLDCELGPVLLLHDGSVQIFLIDETNKNTYSTGDIGRLSLRVNLRAVGAP